MPRPWVVGLTGSFGSGKTTVAGLLRKKGAPVVSSDRIAHEVFQKRNPLYPKIQKLFRKELRVDRARVAEIVFQDARRRRALESLVHPYVFKRIREEIKKTKRPVVVVEIPLLFESGFDRQCDRTVTVVTQKKKIFDRLARRGGVAPPRARRPRPYTRKEIEARLRAQLPVAEKARRADEVINNSGSLRGTREEVNRLWKKWSAIIKP